MLGISVLGEGDSDQACGLLEESLAGFQALGDLRFMAVVNTWLGHAMLRRGEAVRAAALMTAALEGHQAVGDRVYFLVYTLLHFAEVLNALELPVLAIRLLGAGEGAARAARRPLPVPRSARHTALVAALCAQLPAATFDAVWAAGRALTLEETMTEAISAARQLTQVHARSTTDLPAGAQETRIQRKQ